MLSPSQREVVVVQHCHPVGLRDKPLLRVRARRAAVGPVPLGHVHIRGGRGEDRDAAEEGRAAALARVGAGQGRPSRYRNCSQPSSLNGKARRGQISSNTDITCDYRRDGRTTVDAHEAFFEGRGNMPLGGEEINSGYKVSNSS